MISFVSLQHFQRHTGNQNLIAIIPVDEHATLVGGKDGDVQVNPLLGHSGSNTKMPISLPSSVANVVKVVQNDVFVVGEDRSDEDKPKLLTKFSRFEDSDSDDSDEIEISFNKSDTEEEIEYIIEEEESLLEASPAPSVPSSPNQKTENISESVDASAKNPDKNVVCNLPVGQKETLMTNQQESTHKESSRPESKQSSRQRHSNAPQSNGVLRTGSTNGYLDGPDKEVEMKNSTKSSTPAKSCDNSTKSSLAAKSRDPHRSTDRRKVDDTRRADSRSADESKRRSKRQQKSWERRNKLSPRSDDKPDTEKRKERAKSSDTAPALPAVKEARIAHADRDRDRLECRKRKFEGDIASEPVKRSGLIRLKVGDTRHDRVQRTEVENVRDRVQRTEIENVRDRVQRTEVENVRDRIQRSEVETSRDRVQRSEVESSRDRVQQRPQVEAARDRCERDDADTRHRDRFPDGEPLGQSLRKPASSKSNKTNDKVPPSRAVRGVAVSVDHAVKGSQILSSLDYCHFTMDLL